MAFGKHAALTARGVGPYHDRVLVVENIGAHAATGITITFTGQQGPADLLAGHVETLQTGEAVRVPLHPMRRGAVFKVAVRWISDEGEPGQFFGVLTAGD